MPHFGLVPEHGLSEDQMLLLRSRLHVRSGLRRIREENYSAGIATLYDALVSAMHFYILAHKPILSLLQYNEFVSSDLLLYNYLTNEKTIKSSFDFKKFQELMNTGLDSSLKKTDINDSFLISLQDIFTQLAILPFNDADLPPENPALL